MMLGQAGIVDYFDFLLSNEDVTKPKPDPEMYIRTMRALKLKPPECLVIEDNEKGVQAVVASKAHLLKVDSVEDVNYTHIRERIRAIDGGRA